MKPSPYRKTLKKLTNWMAGNIPNPGNNVGKDLGGRFIATSDYLNCTSYREPKGILRGVLLLK